MPHKQHARAIVRRMYPAVNDQVPSLVSGESHETVQGAFDELTSAAMSDDGQPEVQVEGLTLEFQSDDDTLVYDFPEEVTVARLRTSPPTVRLSDDEARQVVMNLDDSPASEPSWQLMSAHGFNPLEPSEAEPTSE